MRRRPRAKDDRWGRTYESFGEDPALVRSLETVIDGLQGRPGQLDDADRVLATAKHYAGDGLTAFGTGEGDYTIDQGIDQVSLAEFEKLSLSPYPTANDEHHVGSVMPSFSSVDWTEDGLGNPVKMHANKELVTDVLTSGSVVDGIRASIDRYAQPEVTAAVRVVPARLGDRAEITGAVALAIARVATRA